MNRITRAALLATAAAVSLGVALPTWAQAPAVSKADADLNAAWQQMAVANYAPGFQAALMAWRQEQVSKATSEVKEAQARLTEEQKANAALTQQVAALTKQGADDHRRAANWDAWAEKSDLAVGTDPKGEIVVTSAKMFCLPNVNVAHPMSTPATGSR
jgi:hypothetical protein